MANEMDPNEESLRPALWSLALMAMIIAGVSALLYWGWEIGSIYAVIGATIGGTIGLSWATAMHLSPNGLRMGKVRVPWSDLSVSRGRLGEWLHGPSHLPRRQNIKVFLPMYEISWRRGRVGAQARRHAPHLLGDVDAR